jgi:putative SOS response-associated peptidase YedK
LLPVITHSGRQGISWFYWGRPPHATHNKALGEKIINLPLDTLAEKPALQKAILKHRCIIPADGWYGWKKVGKKTMIPYRFTLLQQPLLFSLAGTWEEYEDESGEMVHTFRMLTVPASSQVAPIDEHMPVILNAEQEEKWLSAAATDSELMSLLQQISPPDLQSYTVSPRINDPENEHPSLILPAPSSDQFGNLTLFN